MIVAVALVAGAGTYAIFSETVEVTGNTVAAGTFNLTVNKSAGKPYNVTDAFPGFQTPNWENIDIFNEGSLPFEASISFAKTSGSDALYNKLRIVLKTDVDSNCDNLIAGEAIIYDGLISTFPAGATNPISSINYWGNANEDDASGSPADNIRAGWSERVCQKVGVDNSAGIEIQGQTTTFKEVVNAVQDND